MVIDGITFENSEKVDLYLLKGCNKEPVNPKKVHLNSWFEDMSFQKNFYLFCFSYISGDDGISAQIYAKITKENPKLMKIRRHPHIIRVIVELNADPIQHFAWRQ